uniref:Tubulin-specific chaperone D n=1 Tax=Schistocephalus solidus TaxID=70667 RepID=A0A0X3P4X5_SCHSO
MLNKCIRLANQFSSNPDGQHFVFKVIHLMTKTRGYKNLIRLMPHTVDDLEPVFNLLSSQDCTDKQNWQTRYVLLLWLSIVVMVPFGLSRLEKPGKPPLIARILNEAKRHVVLDEVTQEAAAYLIAKFISRPDVHPTELESTISWAANELASADYGSHNGQMRVAGCLRSLANICKIVARKVLVPHASKLLQITLDLPDISQTILLYRLRTKLIQRIGLIFCPRRAAAARWRYQRGFRSLADNLCSRLPLGDILPTNGTDASLQPSGTTKDDAVQSYLTIKPNHVDRNEEVDEEEEDDDDDDGDFDVPEEVADVVDNLMDALKSKFTFIRWSAAKGLGRICSRLTAPFVEDVLSAILGLCTRLETFSAWHGASLALAELGRRCLLLPEKLEKVIPVVLTALFYDEKSGDCNYGSNVRDAACYCCWAFARAYKASDFASHVEGVSRKLILSALFDRELNVRRAAAAAFQENAGRQGQFPHGIEIITTCDYFAVGNISNCYLNLSCFVASFPEYTPVIIDHLAFSRLGHWDEHIRDLAGKALHKLTPCSKDQILGSVIPKLLERTLGPDLYMRQGSVIGLAEIMHALSSETTLPPSLLSSVEEIIPKLNERHYFRGVTGELMRRACCRLIEKSSLSNLNFHEGEILETWRNFLDECLQYREPEIQDPAISAYAAFLTTYLFDKNGKIRDDYRNALLLHLLSSVDAKNEWVQIGYLGVLGQAPGVLFEGKGENTLTAISSCCVATQKTLCWCNARQKGLQALTSVVSHIGLNSNKITEAQINDVLTILLNSLSDYTTDSRGDIGSIVREAGMHSLLAFCSDVVNSGRSGEIKADVMESIFVNVAQQAVEVIDRTRAVAGRVFTGLLHHKPQMPHIPHETELRRIFNEKICADISWLTAQSTFPLFVQLFDLPEFQYHLMLGFAASAGGVTEKTIQASSYALRSHMITHEADPAFLLNFMQLMARIFISLRDYSRICVPLLKFLDLLLCDPLIAATMENHLDILDQLLNSTWIECRLSKNVPKLKAAIDVYGAMVQFSEPIRTKSVSFLVESLRHRYPFVRKAAASKLFESLLVYEMVDPESNEEVSTLLSETVWEEPLSEVNPVRETICQLLHIPSSRPVVLSPPPSS